MDDRRGGARKAEAVLRRGQDGADLPLGELRCGAADGGLDYRGEITPDKLPDLVVVDGNSAADIRATRNIRWIFKRGRRLTPDDLVPKASER